MNNIDLYKLENELRQGKVRDVYFLHGNDAYLFSRAYGLITAESADIESLYLQKATEEEISAPFVSYFFGDSKCVCVYDLTADLASAKQRAFFDAISEMPEGTKVLIYGYQDTDRVKQAPQSLLKQFSPSLDVAVIDLIGGDHNTVNKEILSIIKNNDIKAEKEALERIKEYCDNDLSLIGNEILKIASYGNGRIDVESVDLLCTRSSNAWIYSLISSVEYGKTRESLSLLSDLFAQGMKPSTMISIISDSYINVFNAKCAMLSGKSSSEMLSDFGIKPSKKYEVAWNKARKMTLERMNEIIGLLYETDKQIKSINTDPQILVTECICKIISVYQNKVYK
ncbi:MAG: hypothetical protein IKE27_07810 [Oscillospiraceae bacterium]|nr:hypothetical protein [Oscillospiraceae bacterium]